MQHTQSESSTGVRDKRMNTILQCMTECWTVFIPNVSVGIKSETLLQQLHEVEAMELYT